MNKKHGHGYQSSDVGLRLSKGDSEGSGSGDATGSTDYEVI